MNYPDTVFFLANVCQFVIKFLEFEFMIEDDGGDGRGLLITECCRNYNFPDSWWLF
jgi:hypothetical protein